MRRSSTACPTWLPNLTARLFSKQGADELAIRHLEQAYASTSSEETRAQIRGKLEVLQHRSLVERMESGRKEFEADLARGYDYAPEAFSVIAGPRRPRFVELPAGSAGSPTPAPGPPPTR